MDAIKQLPKLKPIYTTGTMQSCNLQENTTDARFMVYAVIVLLLNGMGITLWLCYLQVSSWKNWLKWVGRWWLESIDTSSPETLNLEDASKFDASWKLNNSLIWMLVVSGRLPPISSLCAELNLLPQSTKSYTSFGQFNSLEAANWHLRTIPTTPLEANHVI